MTFRTFLAAAALLTLPGLALAQSAPAPATDMKGMAMKGATSPATQAYMDAMHAMHEKTMAMTPTNDPNKDFVIMMKPHHQAAVDMAEAYLKYGNDPMLRTMARDIVSSQKKEIGEMNAWETKHGVAAP